jgi:hypothetical protein
MPLLDLDGTEQPMDPKLVMAIESAFRRVSMTDVVFLPAPRAWQKANPAGSAKGPKGMVKANLRMQIVRRDGARCAYCAREFVDLDDATLDHVIPNSVVGHWQAWNLVLACEACNGLKADGLPLILMPLVCHLLRELLPLAQQKAARKKAAKKAKKATAVPTPPIPTCGYPSRSAFRKAQQEIWRRRSWVNWNIQRMSGVPVRLAIEAAPVRAALPAGGQA